MKKPTLTLLFTIALLPLTTAPAQAQTEDRYISDVLHVPLRSGTSNQHRIIHRGLPSGTRVQFIREEMDANDEPWSLVELANGEQGWVRNQFLLTEPTAALRLERAQQTATNLGEQRRQLQGQVEELNQQNQTLQQQLAELQGRYDQQVAETQRIQDISRGAVDLHEEHRRLNEAHQLLRTRTDVLQAETEQLRRNHRHRDWITGGGILFGGVLLALLLQAISRSRRQSEWR